MKHLSIFILAITLFTGFGFNHHAAAQLPGNNERIHVSFIMVLGKKADGMVESRPVSSFYTVRLAEDVRMFCQNAHKIRETLLAYMTKFPPLIGKNKRLQLDGIGAKVVPYINRTLGRVVVTEAVLIEGGAKLTKGAAAGLPFTKFQGCGRTMEEYEVLMNELLNKRQQEEDAK